MPRPTRGTILAGLFLLLHAGLAWALRAPTITTTHDDAVYLLLARGLRHLSYNLFWLVGSPPESQYPPLYPLMLVLAGDNLNLALALNIAFSTGGLALVFALVRRWSEPIALLALALAAVNPGLVGLAGQVYSEPLFLFTTAAGLWFLDPTRSSPRHRVAGAALALAAFFSRIIGSTLVAAALLQWTLERHYRAALALGLPVLVLLGAWFVRSSLAPRDLPGQSYIADVSYRPSDAPPGILPTLEYRVMHNLRAYAADNLPSAAAVPLIESRVGAGLWDLVFALLGAVGLVQLGRRHLGAALFLIGYGSLLLLWPYALLRYLIPVMPLVFVVLLLGAVRVAGPAAPVRWAVMGMLVLPLLAGALRSDALHLADMRRCDRTVPFASPGCFSAEQQAFFRAAHDVAQLTPPGSIFLAPKAATLYYLTGRRSVDALHAGSLSPVSLRAYLKEHGVSHLLLSRVHLDQKWLTERLLPSCSDWSLLRDYGNDALLFERSTGSPSGGESCEAMARFVKGRWVDYR